MIPTWTMPSRLLLVLLSLSKLPNYSNACTKREIAPMYFNLANFGALRNPHPSVLLPPRCRRVLNSRQRIRLHLVISLTHVELLLVWPKN